MNYKKSILSMAAVLALSSMVNASSTASYLPLTTKANDKAWVMFGVNGFGTGVPSTTNATAIFTPGYQVVTEDDLSDDLATPFEGIGATSAASGSGIFASSDGKNMATIQAIKKPDGTPYFTGISVAVAIDSATSLYTETETVRSMYLAIEPNDNIAKVKVNYKASLEGKSIELQIDGVGTVYKGKISQTATFDHPEVLRDVQPVDLGTAKTKPEDTLVYDLSQAPVNAAAYDSTKDQGVATGNERFYYYNANTQTWELWDRANSISENSLTAFEKGRAYWGRMDINGDNTTTSAKRAGLYLGNNTGLNEADASVYTGKLVPDAWNMIAFDPAKDPDIRTSTTGLIVSTSDDFSDSDKIVVLDESRQNSLTIAFDTNGTKGNAAALFMNKAIEEAKILGTMPDNFNLKVYSIADHQYAFIADKRFTIQDDAGDANLTDATTLAGKDPMNWDGSINSITDVKDGSDANNSDATSLYGEYAMIVEPLVGANTASQLDSEITGGSTGSAAVQFGNINGDTASKTLLGTDDTATDLVSAAAAFNNDDTFKVGPEPVENDSTGQVLQLDVDENGTNDMLLLAATKPFYIKDNTFTRVYTVDATQASGKILTIMPKKIETAPIGGNTIGDINTSINAKVDDGKVYATIDPNDSDKLVVVSEESLTVEINDVKSASAHLLTTSSSDSNIAKGAIKRVLDVSKLARTKVARNKYTIKFTADANGDGEGDIKVNGLDQDTNTTIDQATTTDAICKTVLKSFVENVNKTMAANNIAGSASYEYLDGTNSIKNAQIIIEGVGITSVSIDENDTGLTEDTPTDANAANAGKIDPDAALLSANLRANAIYTPDYVSAGPLYTLKKAGYEAKVIVKPTTKFAATPTTSWSNIDLTRDSKYWLKSNEYNLFNVDKDAGYWAYITNYSGGSSVSVGDKVFNPSFVYHFNNVTNVSENIINSGTVSFDILDSSQPTGKVNAETSNIKLIVNGEKIQAMKSGTAFTAILTKDEAGLEPDNGQDITVALKVADGIGDAPYEDSALFTLDYNKPAAPTLAFNANMLTLSDSSADTAAYYLWEDYIPDDVTSPLVAKATAPINMCQNFAFASQHNLKAIALDGSGDLGKANASNITSFSYINLTKGATVITQSNGSPSSTSVVYDDTCNVIPNEVAKKGLDIRTVIPGTASISYQALGANMDATTDVPFTAYIDIDGNAVKTVEVMYFQAYAGKTVYIEYNGKLVSATLPTTRADADATFTTPVTSSLVHSDNQTLAQ